MTEQEKNEILDDELDMEELEAIDGGKVMGSSTYAPNGRVGNCAKDYFSRPCAATVEDGSWCKTNDACVIASEKYRSIDSI